MSTSPAQPFLDALTRDIVARAGGDDRLLPFARALGSVDGSRARYSRAEPFDHPAMPLLDRVLEGARGTPGLIEAVRQVAPVLQWYQIFRDDGLDRTLSQGMLAAQVAGNVGMVDNAELRCGMFLLAPGLHYPLHTHGASEIYYGLSGEVELTYGLDRGSYALMPGGVAVTPSHRLHSLTTHDAPALLIYVWIGAMDDPNWWWSRQPDGSWLRAKWVRTPDASWRLDATEPVTEQVRRQALGRDTGQAGR